MPIVENIIKKSDGDEAISFIETFKPDFSLASADGVTL